MGDIIGLLLDPGMQPFAVALGIVAALCLLEILLTLLGLSLLGGGGAEAELDLPDAAPGDVAASGDAVAGGLSWLGASLGIGQVPFSLWLAGVLTAFGVSGYLLQLAAVSAFGGTAPALPAALVAAAPGLALGRRIARLVARVLPQTETSAISTRSYGGRAGVIVTGTARRGLPAEARFRDGHGNTHYVLVEPLRDGEELGQGEEIAILRLRDGRMRAIRLGDAGASPRPAEP